MTQPTFILQKPGAERIVNWPVVFSFPDENGEIQTCRFRARFKVCPISEVEKLVAASNGNPDSTLLREVFVGAQGIGQENDADEIEEVVWSDAVRDQLTDDYAVKQALLTAYFDCVQGRKEKN